MRTNRIEQAVFDALLKRHGVQWLVELTAITNFYVALCGVVNAFDVAYRMAGIGSRGRLRSGGRLRSAGNAPPGANCRIRSNSSRLAVSTGKPSLAAESCIRALLRQSFRWFGWKP